MSSTKTQQPDRTAPDINPWWLIVISGFIWYICGFVVPEAGDRTPADTAGTFGDQFGAVNALFSGLALAGVLWTIWQQRQEIGLLSKQIKALEEDQEESQRIAVAACRIQALAALVESYSQAVYGSHPTSKYFEADTLDRARNDLREALHQLEMSAS